MAGTPYYVAASWVGYDYNKSLSDTQKTYARSLWNQAMKVVHQGLSPTPFTKKGNTVERYYCMTTGELATDACPDKELGVYKPDFMPASARPMVRRNPPQPSLLPRMKRRRPRLYPGCRTSRGDGAGQLPFPGGLTVARIPNLKRR